MNILLVEDNMPDIDLFLERISKISNIKPVIEIAQSFKEATNKLLSKSFDIVFLDLGLPETHGSETVDKMHKFIKSNNIKANIVVLTGTEDYSIGKLAIEDGFKDFLTKSTYNSDTLKRVISFLTYNKELPNRRLSFKKD